MIEHFRYFGDTSISGHVTSVLTTLSVLGMDINNDIFFFYNDIPMCMLIA